MESVGPVERLISPDEQKVAEFLNIGTPTTKKEVQQICGMAAQMKKFAPGMQIKYPGMQKFLWTADLEKELEDLKECL